MQERGEREHGSRAEVNVASATHENLYRDWLPAQPRAGSALSTVGCPVRGEARPADLAGLAFHAVRRAHRPGIGSVPRPMASTTGTRAARVGRARGERKGEGRE